MSEGKWQCKKEVIDEGQKLLAALAIYHLEKIKLTPETLKLVEWVKE